jgi:hypothetical protein
MVAISGCNSDQEPAASAGGAAGAGGNGSAGGNGGTVLDAAGEDSTAHAALALFVASNFIDNEVKLVAVDWSSQSILGTAVIPTANADAQPFASHGHGFLLESSASKLRLLSSTEPWTSVSSIDLSGSHDSGMGTDPVAVVSTETKAYLPLYFANQIAIVDLQTKAVVGSIGLSQFLDPSDNDGLVDVWDAAYDESAHRAYFLLQRMPQKEPGIEPDFVGRCLEVAPLVVGVDTTNDEIIDLNGNAEGVAIPLLGANPSALVPDFATGRLFAVDTGCYEAPEGGLGDAGPDAKTSLPRKRRGIESVSLASGDVAWRYQYTGTDRVSRLVWVDGTHAFVGRDDANFQPHWYSWDPSTTELGAEVPMFPKYAPRVVRDGSVVGIAPVSIDGGNLHQLVSFDVASGKAVTVVPDLFADPKFDPPAGRWALLE